MSYQDKKWMKSLICILVETLILRQTIFRKGSIVNHFSVYCAVM